MRGIGAPPAADDRIHRALAPPRPSPVDRRRHRRARRRARRGRCGVHVGRTAGRHRDRRAGRADRAVALDPAGRPAAAGRHPHPPEPRPRRARRRPPPGRRDPRGPRCRLAEPPPHGVRHAQPGARPRRVRLGEPRPAHAAHRRDRRAGHADAVLRARLDEGRRARDDRLDAAGGRPAARALRRLRRARRGGRAAVPAGRAGAGVERAQGLLPDRPEPLGPGGLHGALQRGVPGGEGRPARRGGRRPVRRARQPRPGAAGRVGPARAVGHDRPPRARRRRLLAHAQGRRRLRGRRRQHQDPGRHPPAHPRRRRPEVRGRRPVAARPHGPADLVGRVLRGRPRRSPGRSGEPGQRRGHPRRRRGVRGDGGAGGHAVGPAGRRAAVRRAVDRQHHARRGPPDAADRRLAVAGAAARRGPGRDRALAHPGPGRVPGRRRVDAGQPDRLPRSTRATAAGCCRRGASTCRTARGSRCPGVAVPLRGVGWPPPSGPRPARRTPRPGRPGRAAGSPTGARSGPARPPPTPARSPGSR